jgi:acyl carrier protein
MATTLSTLKELMLAIGIDNDLVQGLDPDMLLTQQGFDSLDYPAFAMAVEQQCGVKISDADSLRLKSLNDFMQYLNARA